MKNMQIEAWVLFDDESDKPYFKVDSYGCFAIYENEASAQKAKGNHPGSDYKKVTISKYE